jgi:glutamate synthase (NADPH/NADH) small chain
VERIADHNHVYRPVPLPELRLQASRCMDCGVPFCTSGCPLGNLIPDWNDLVHRNTWREAWDRLQRTNNFPEFTGLLCPAPCEAACVLAIDGDAVTIKDIELSIVERAFEEGWVAPRPPALRTGKRVAVVGSGPAGLAAAQELNRVGHEVTVFERDDRLGGLLRYGIPDFKIEKWLVDRRIELLHAEGITFEAGCHVGEDLTVDELRARFDAILLAVGALAGRDVDLPGRGLDGIHLAMDYLVGQNRRVAGDRPTGQTITARSKRVVIIGGGDTSADCLGDAHREGAASIQVLTHGPQPPHAPQPLTWPDWPLVLRSYPAHEEGGERHWSLAVTGFSGSGGQVERVHVVDAMRDEGGAVHHVPGTERALDADLVLLAIGFEGPVRDRLLHDLGVGFGENGAIRADRSYRTSAPDVFVAGDAHRGASLIVWAIAEGRAAAKQIDQALMPAAAWAGVT